MGFQNLILEIDSEMLLKFIQGRYVDLGWYQEIPLEIQQIWNQNWLVTLMHTFG